MVERPSPNITADNDPVEDKIIRIRAFIAPNKTAKKKPRRARFLASQWALVFDTETRVDPGQALRFGVYQLRYNGLLVEHGLLYDPDILAADEVSLLQRMARELPISADGESIRLRTRQEFIDEVLLRTYAANGRIIGFNLPFDLSRLALHHGPARKGMVGGFSFILSNLPNTPRLRMKSISARAALIQFEHWNEFVDVKTLAGALLGGNYSLEYLTETLDTRHKKVDRDDHGEALSEEYVQYAINDVHATWECYLTLKARLDSYKLPNADPSRLYSEASLGKTYLQAMNVRPWLECQDDFPDELSGITASTYFGGRAEVHIRRTPTRVVLCDFLSMYPTVSTLMGSWRFVIAEGVDWCEATEETRALVAAIGPCSLRDPHVWKQLPVLVQVLPKDDRFPVRACYGQDGMASIGLNHLTTERPLWFTLADVLVSEILTGRSPEIVRAIRFTPRTIQKELRAISICGADDFRVNPAQDDFYKRIIERRKRIQATAEAASGADKPELEAEQQALKILASATGYGIFAQLNVKPKSDGELFTCHFGQGAPVLSDQYEAPGPFFHPLLATLITGGARLMLALAERAATDAGLSWAFCDTDSLAVARPDEMSEPDFQRRLHDVVHSFQSLNPYEGNAAASILQIEKLNYKSEDKTELNDLQCIAISAKRYVLYTLAEDGTATVRKGSQHGLGHLYAPYEDEDRRKRLKRIKVERWQEDYWLAVIRAIHSSNPDALPKLVGFDGPAASRYSATSPELLRWFDRYNADKPYAEQVKPFNFLFSQQAKSEMARLGESLGTDLRDGTLRPAAPFARSVEKAAALAFDRRTGNPVPPSELRSLKDALADYDRHAESKSLGGAKNERGVLCPRHIRVIAIQPIGKETEALDVSETIGEAAPGVVHTLAPEDRAALVHYLKTRKYSVRRLCAYAGVHHSTLRDAKSGRADDAILVRLAEASAWMNDEPIASEDLIACIRELAPKIGVSALAQQLDVDPSNLGKMLSGKRRISVVVARRITELMRPMPR